MSKHQLIQQLSQLHVNEGGYQVPMSGERSLHQWGLYTTYQDKVESSKERIIPVCYGHDKLLKRS